MSLANDGANTYPIDTESGAEMARLLDLDRLATQSMGGLFPELSDLSTIFDTLDIGCGPGGWVLEVAHAYPEMEVTGIDISRSMIQYAQAHAQVRQLPNAKFRVMDACKPLDFPDHTFDLVNARSIVGFMLPQAWPSFVRECVRIARPGGIIRLTEGEGFGITTSPAFEALSALGMRAMSLAGRTFTPHGNSLGITPMLRRFLHEAGCQHIQYRPHVLDYSSGTEAQQPFCRNLLTALQLAKPFFLQLGITTSDEFDELYRQAEMETAADTFYALCFSITVWGQTPAA